MVFAEEIRTAILKVAEERGPGRTFNPADVARIIDANNWPQLIDQVKFVAGVLIDEGKIVSKATRENITQEFSKPDHSR